MSFPEMDKATLDQPKERTARLPVISSTGLALMKFVVGFTIGPISIISEAIHSSMDLIAAVIAFFCVARSTEKTAGKKTRIMFMCTVHKKNPANLFWLNPSTIPHKYRGGLILSLKAAD
jgi:predicted Co/Zn/Cd cation transporter (cation efflux family)